MYSYVTLTCFKFPNSVRIEGLTFGLDQLWRSELQQIQLSWSVKLSLPINKLVSDQTRDHQMRLHWIIMCWMLPGKMNLASLFLLLDICCGMCENCFVAPPCGTLEKGVLVFSHKINCLWLVYYWCELDAVMSSIRTCSDNLCTRLLVSWFFKYFHTNIRSNMIVISTFVQSDVAVDPASFQNKRPFRYWISGN